MQDGFNLQRFVDAHRRSYDTALAEIRKGKKTSHWMWWIFPQLAGLGSSHTSKQYAIRGLQEAAAFLHHPILGPNLLRISNALLQLETNHPTAVFATPDDMKLQSSITLFALVPETNPVFQQVLDKFFKGAIDQQTLKMIEV
ncbi:MAG: DUF1810 domain-containing protein [Chitinophagaceae bacterium]